MMTLTTTSRKSFVCRDQQHPFLLNLIPKDIIPRAFFRCAANIEYIMAQPTQCPDRHEWNILVHKNLHNSQSQRYDR